MIIKNFKLFEDSSDYLTFINEIISKSDDILSEYELIVKHRNGVSKFIDLYKSPGHPVGVYNAAILLRR